MALWLCTAATGDLHLMEHQEDCVGPMELILAKLQFANVCLSVSEYIIDNYYLIFIQTYTAITCGRLSDPENGAVRQRRPAIVGSVAVYICNRGFRLVGQRKRVCQSNGRYSGQAPTCVGMYSSKLTTRTHYPYTLLNPA